jgi:hypothetical protein
MLGANAPALKSNSEGVRTERRHPINDNEPVDVQLQLHQKLIAKAIDEVVAQEAPRT